MSITTSTEQLALEVTEELGNEVELNASDFTIEAISEMPLALRQAESSFN